MIPKVIPPLTGLSVLVTRPAAQAASLTTAIEQKGGVAMPLPAISIEPIAAADSAEHDLVIFISANAAAHGVGCIQRSPATRIAAIGKATADALAAANMPVDIVPEGGFNSEALLAHPALSLAPGTRVLIVRGAGGRELLQESFSARGCTVATLEVYRRALPKIEPSRIAELVGQWSAGDIDIVTATSVQTLQNLIALLGAAGREFLARTPLLVASERIAVAATELGLHGECVTATGADDAALIGTLSSWHARGRSLGVRSHEVTE